MPTISIVRVLNAILCILGFFIKPIRRFYGDGSASRLNFSSTSKAIFFIILNCVWRKNVCSVFFNLQVTCRLSWNYELTQIILITHVLMSNIVTTNFFNCSWLNISRRVVEPEKLDPIERKKYKLEGCQPLREVHGPWSIWSR